MDFIALLSGPLAQVFLGGIGALGGTFLFKLLHMAVDNAKAKAAKTPTKIDDLIAEAADGAITVAEHTVVLSKGATPKK